MGAPGNLAGWCELNSSHGKKKLPELFAPAIAVGCPFVLKPASLTPLSLLALGKIALDQSDFVSRYEPGHPAADGRGYVRYPNVNSLVETMDMREAQRSYEANLKIISATRRMIQRTLDILKA